MCSRFLTLGFLVALAGSGAGLRAQQWTVTVGPWTFDDVTALSVFNLTSPSGPNQLSTITRGDFTRLWRGDEVLEAFATNQIPGTVDLGFDSPFADAALFASPGATLTQWELKAEDGLSATETVTFNDSQPIVLPRS